jgi:lactoylglutathione lyase
MSYRMVHTNFNVFDLEKSLSFYREALNLQEVRRITSPDKSHSIVFLSDGNSGHQLELTWLRDWSRPYDLGDAEFHLAFTTDDYARSYAKHQEMGCICQEARVPGGFYFIADPDGYWLEILPVRITT